MKTLILILSLLLLTSCSNPDTSGGVTLSRDGNEFPYGSCEGQGKKELSDKRTGCGWIHVNEESHYIMPSAHLRSANLRGADLTRADLRDADLSGADLTHADLRGAKRSGVKADSRTTCPNREKWGTRRHDCGF